MRKFLCGWLCFQLLFTACQSDRVISPDSDYLDPARVDADPSAYLRISDSLLQGKDGLETRDRISILLARQHAFARLNLLDSVFETGVRIRAAATETGDTLAIARSLLPIRGNISRFQQLQFEPYLEGALQTFRSSKMAYEEGVILGLMGFVDTRKANLEKAVQHLQGARSILEPMDSIRALYPVMLNLGNSYSALGQYGEAAIFSRKSFELAERMQDSLRMAMALQNLAILYQAQQQTDSTIHYMQTSMRYAPASAGQFLPLQLSYNLADAYRTAGLLPAAETNYTRVLAGFQQLGSREGMAMAQRGLALLYGQTGREGAAIDLMESSLRGLDSAGNRIQMVEQYQELIELYKKAGRTAAALEAATQMKQLSDSLISVEKSIAVKELEYRYQTEKKEAENRTLRKQVRLRNYITLALTGLLLLFFLLMYVLRQRNRYHRKLSQSYAKLVETYIHERDMVLARSQSLKDPETLVSVTPAEQDRSEPSPAEKRDAFTDRVILEKMLLLFRDEKIHLDPNLKAEDIADRLGVSARKLSGVLKAAGEPSISQLVNQSRVAEASRLQEDPEASLYKLDVIATLSGFSNRQHFRRVFEQVTGVNPGSYRTLSRQQSSWLPDAADETDPI